MKCKRGAKSASRTSHTIRLRLEGRSYSEIARRLNHADPVVVVNRRLDVIKNERRLVYFARLRDGTIRIGWTRNIGRRLDSLKKRFGADVTLVACVPGTRQNALSTRFFLRRDRVRNGMGVCFRPSGSVMRHIDSFGFRTSRCAR